MSSDLASKKKERAVIRRLFTKTANELESNIKEEHFIDSPAIYALYMKLNEFVDSLLELDKTIKDIILIQFEEDELEKELESQYEYKERWMMVKAMYKVKKPTSGKANQEKRCFKLPQLELIHFDGHLKNWLPFWGQFSKINEDESIDDTDKFMYLLQSMKIGSEVRELVQGFPGTAYKSCIEELKSRFAREDLLIQIYIREILSLVLMDDKQKDVSKLYDKLSAHLRALETLKVTKDKYAAFLLPMVESALPHDTLKIWERSRQAGETTALELTGLLTFLRKEIESDQRLEISKNTFNHQQEIPLTAECLISNIKTKNNNCIWCDKDSHATIECYKINRLTIEQRKAILREKKACPICLRRGHHPKVCRAPIKCLICSKRHSIVLCPEQKSDEVKKKIPDSATALSSMQSKGEILLQTVVVEIQYKERKQQVRALLDSGSQRTYIKKDVVEQLNIPHIEKEVLTHVLFGGIETKSREFYVHDFTIKSIDNSFNINIKAISQDNICGYIPKVNSKDTQLIKMLAKNNVTLTDKGNNKDIGLLIGADFLGFLLTDTMIQLKDGLVAVKTKLGWTLQGKYVSVNNVLNNFTTMLHCMCDHVLSDHWSLETLGIRDPVEMKNQAEIEVDTMTNFKETVKKTEENRYVVKLPFKTDIDDLLPNYEIAKRRLESMTKKLIHSGKFHEYDSVFKNWQNFDIIELTENIPNSGHYLPHRPVIKEQSLTSSIRPVFDASAKGKNGLSLNACLEKGSNLIDLIPKLINNFRTGMIGITSDIEKAFLQIGLMADDRDFLKFLWYKDETLQELVTYRHCRVVFGLTTSPFLLAATLHHYLNEFASDPLLDTAELLDRSFYVDNCVVSVDTKEEAEKFITEAKIIMSSANFNLRMWVTSHGINETTISVLGLKWDTVTDELNCNNLPPIDNLQNVTKRMLLSLTQRVFDPIGYTAPILPIPNSDVTDFDEIDSKGFNTRLKYIQTLRDQFRQRFKTEYLTFLVQKGNEKKDTIRVGDVVLVETAEKRIKWPIGIIEELYVGRDGVERTVRVKTSTGIKIRPVQRIYKLEVSSDNDFYLSHTAKSSRELEKPTTATSKSSTKVPDNNSNEITTLASPGAHKHLSRIGRQVNLPSKFDMYYL